MNADDEILLYLQFLLEHKADCQAERCSSCLALDGILECIRYQMFSGPVFPEVMISTRGIPSTRRQPAERVPAQPPPMRKVREQTSRSNPDCLTHP